MTDTRIARRYASAIFALGENEGKTANAKRGETLKALDSLLDESPALDRVFKSPIITVSQWPRKRRSSAIFSTSSMQTP